MQRHLGTALSVIGLLAVGTAAAAVNVHMLHHTGGEKAAFQIRAAGDVLPVATSDANRSTVTLGPGNGGNRLSSPDSPTVSREPVGPTGLGSLGSVVGGRGGFASGNGDEHAFGTGNRPKPTVAQMALLRISAMVRTDPETVRAIARGTYPDATLLTAVKAAAKAVGITLGDLAAVEQLPPMHGRGHGGPGDPHHEGLRIGTPSVTLTYDD